LEYYEFLSKIINDGIEAAKADYNKPKDEHRLSGSLEGFESCRNKSPDELSTLLLNARKEATEKLRHDEKVEEYWFHRCKELEIEWVCNCVSAILQNHGLPTLITPTARGVLKAAEVVGVKDTV
jgi:hypothetical protein